MAEALDLKTVVEAFRIMGEYLRDRNTLGEVVVYVGSAIMLQFKWRSSTRDVDALITSVGNHGMVQFAADEAARRLALPSSWLSESVAMYTSRSEADTDRIPFGVYPSYERPGLRVLAARAEYVLAMKVMALERSTFDDRDFQDAIRLGGETNTETVTDLEQLVSRAAAMNRPQSLSDVATSARNDIHGFASALAELLDEFYLDAEDVDRQARLDSRPTPTDDAEVNSWLGAVGEHLARRWNLRVPLWVEEPVFMGQDSPQFYPPSANLRGLLIVESPPAFRRRLLFTFAEPLLRARFPAGMKAVMPFSLDSPAAPEN